MKTLPNPHHIVAALAFTTGILAADPAADADSSAELAKKLANPIANPFTINSESTYDWTADQWTIPFNAGVSQILKLDSQPVSVGLMGTWYAQAPDSAPYWGVRLVFTFLFPKS